tara:strand:- start:2975 stop:5131 length:2157 start_codon:yes stop_codon:yes gene_type:complete
MDQITGVIDRITYQHDNGFLVAKIQTETHPNRVTITGVLFDIYAGQSITCIGQWETNAQYGRQFRVHEWSIHRPTTVSGIERYLSSGALKGIGPVYAKKIVDQFGDQTLHILDTDSDQLRHVPGLGKKRIALIQASVQTSQANRDLLIFLADHHVSNTWVPKIQHAYGVNSVSTIQNNPYALAKDISGIGFKTADQLAKSLGIQADHPHRIDMGILHCLGTLNGHTCCPLDGLIKQVATLLQLPPSDRLNQRVYALVNQRQLYSATINNQPMVWMHSIAMAEWGIANELYRIQHTPVRTPLNHVVHTLETLEQSIDLTLDPSQKQAICQAVTQPMHIITGGPGTGKSTLTRMITGLFYKQKALMLLAPTGRAAKRLSQATQLAAKTIHSALSYDFASGSFSYNKKRPLTHDVIIVDEASMIDTLLFYQLLLAIPSHAQLIIIGDVDQLPSIGPGTVLRDILNSSGISTTRLTHIFRQAQHSHIIRHAHAIQRGDYPQFIHSAESDCFFIESDNPEKILDEIADLMAHRLPKKYGIHPQTDCQILSPMNTGPLGVHAFNAKLQALLNSHSPIALTAPDGTCYRQYDKVIQLRNNYDAGVLNGDIGIIDAYCNDQKTLAIRFDERTIEYKHSDCLDIRLAYAVSIHKYQGSECPYVMIPIHRSHNHMLNRNLLYTALTRGKTMVILIGQPSALTTAICNVSAMHRDTGLDYFLNSINPKQ